MAEEIFSEIEEDLQKEKFKKIWRNYGNYIVSIIIFIVILVGGWQLYRYWNFLNFENASNNFYSVLEVSANEPQKGISLIENLDTLPGGYDDLIRFKNAFLNFKIGKKDEANKILKKIYNDDSLDHSYKNIALIISIFNENSEKNLIDFIDKTVLEKKNYNSIFLEAKLSMLISSGKFQEAKLLVKEMKDLDDLPNNMKNRLEMIEYSIGKL